MSEDASVGTCPICLEEIADVNEAFVEECLHHYCFQCITAWVRAQRERGSAVTCPVCKTNFSNVIFDCKDLAFRTWSVFTDSSAKVESADLFFTAAHRRRRSVYINCKELRQTGTRPSCSVTHAILGSAKAQEWIRRELQAVLVEKDVEILVQHVLGFLKGAMKGKKRVPGLTVAAAIESALEPYVPQHANALGNEFLEYISSGLTLAAYDVREGPDNGEGSAHSMPNERGGTTLS